MGMFKAMLGAALLAVPRIAAAQVSDFTTFSWYDGSSRLIGWVAADPDGAGPLPHPAMRMTYDVGGRLVKVESGSIAQVPALSTAPVSWGGFILQKQVDTSYDAMDRKVLEVTGSGGALAATQYSHDALGHLECTAVRMNSAVYGSLPASACDQSVTGSEGPDRIERNSYDAAGQLIKVERGVGTSLRQDYATYTYSPNGKRTTVRDANANLATLQYDGFDRQSAWYFPSKTSVGASSAVDYESYDYDANGNRMTLRRRDGRVLTFTYDALDRMTSKMVPDGCAPNQPIGCPAAEATRDVYYGYDLQGHQIYARFDGTTGEGVTSAYDGFGQLVSSTVAMAGTSRTVTARYDANGNRNQVTTPGGTWTYGYDGLDRLAGLYEGTGTSVLLSTWTYNAQGLRQGVVERFGSAVVWGYDGAGRLTSQTDTFGGGTGNVTATFAYNPASQVTARTRSNDAYAYDNFYNVSRSYGVNGLNQYTSGGPASFGYDANGNLTSDGTSGYTYDAENRLVAMSNGRLTYDPLGRLFQVVASSGTTQFLYDGDQLTAEYDGAGNLTNRYVHGPGDDDPLVWYLGGDQPRWYHRDHQGSIVGLASGASGTLAAINAYDEYGIPKPGNTGRFQYTGQAWIPEIGTYYYKARVYSPTLGRFLQTDPIGYDDQINLYAYVANDPVNAVDSSGKRIKLVGNAAYQREVLREIRQLQSRPAGNEMLSRQISSSNEIVVRPTADGDPKYRDRNRTEANDDNAAIDGTGTGSTIYFDPKNTGGVDVNGSNVRPSAVGLGHEFGHSEDNDQGTRPPASPQRTPGTTPPQEQNAIARENQIRAEHNLPARTTYTPPVGCPNDPARCK